jgi:hypothetical protein
LHHQQDEVERSLYAIEKGLKSNEGFVLPGTVLKEDVPSLLDGLLDDYLSSLGS